MFSFIYFLFPITCLHSLSIKPHLPFNKANSNTQKNQNEDTANENVREAVVKWMELVFKNQNRFQEHMLSKRVSEVLDTVNEMGRSSSLLPSSLTNSTDGLANDFDTNMALRTSFKIACQRGVTGTPQFFLNGVMLFADSGWKMADWTSLIDSLLTPERAA